MKPQLPPHKVYRVSEIELSSDMSAQIINPESDAKVKQSEV